MIAGPRFGMRSTPAMSNRAYEHELGPREGHGHLLRLEAEELRDTVRHVEVERRPATGRRDEAKPRVGVHRDRMADGGQERRVVDAVGVEVAAREVDAVLVGPLAHRSELAVGPHEVADDRAVVRAVVCDAVTGRDHVVEAEQVGERLHEVVGRRRREHEQAALSPMLVDDRPGPRLHPVEQQLRGRLRGLVHERLPPTPRDVRGLAGQRHAREGLADPVEQPEEQPLARDRAARR